MTRNRSIEIPDDLLDRARQGSPASLEDLWERCVPIVEAEIRERRGLSHSDADDLAQEAALLLLGLVKSSPRDATGAAEFAEQFARRLHWQVHGYLRRERRRQRREITGALATLEPTLSKRAAGAPSSGPPGRALQRALEQLSPRQRAVIAGLYERESTVRMLAAEQQVSPQAITALHRRALRALREILTRDGNEGQGREAGG